MQAFALSQAISFHAIIAYILLGIAFVNFIALIFMRIWGGCGDSNNSSANFARINRLSWALTPLFLGFLFILFLSGISVWAMMKFAPSMRIALMIVANFAFVVEILRIKKLRVARVKPSARQSYLHFAIISNALYFSIILYFLVF